VDIDTLVKRARLQQVTSRAFDLDRLRDMLDGTFDPTTGDFTPPFKPGSARYAAWQRAIKTTSTVVPLIINKSLAGIDFNSITWSDAEANKEEVDERVAGLALPGLGRILATDYRLTGVAAAMASTPLIDDDQYGPPSVSVLQGVNIPYSDPRDPTTITGWYRAIQYVTDDGKLRWWVEVYDFVSPEVTVHRVWEKLTSPTDLAGRPDQEFESKARPRFAYYGIQPDGMPTSPLLANMGRILGLYASELRLATSEELAAFPMMYTKGKVELDSVGPAEVAAMDPNGDVGWLDPGSLDELRSQVMLKRDIVREVFNLPGGALGGSQTPSGEALEEANRGFLQETHATAAAVKQVLEAVVNDYLALHNLPAVSIHVPIDRSYTSEKLLNVVEKGIDLGAVPTAVAARAFQMLIGDLYSDEELREFVEELNERRNFQVPGFLPASEVEEA
jgi:hypothetical protein